MSTPRPPDFGPPATPPNAIEVFMLVLAMWSSIQLFFFRPDPLAVDVLLGPVWTVAWAITLAGGSVLALLGLFWPGRLLAALSLQEVGYAAFAPASIARGLALIQIGRADESVVVLAFAAAAIVRIWQLERRIGRFHPIDVVSRLRRVTRRE